MRKMPPLPNKKVLNNGPPHSIQLNSNRIKPRQRHNSIQQMIREGIQNCQQNRDQTTKENSFQNKRQNALMKRSLSARQNSNSLQALSISPHQYRQSKQSLNSRESSRKHRQSPHYNMKMRVSMPSISAHSWVLYEMREERFIVGKGSFKRREIASLTKMMNLITMLKLLENHNLVANRIRINVSREACTMIGTTAQLKPEIQVSLEDLFYGMMLPSGNDAAHQIAQIGGTFLQMIRENAFDKNVIYSCQRLSMLIVQNSQAVGLYINQMNQMGKKMGLSRTTWANPHGLSNVNNISTAEDVAKLCMYGMKNSCFRQIVSTKLYNCVYYYSQQSDEGFEIRKGVLRWQNTNRMLEQGWSGLKTGITPNAGACLASSCKRVMNGKEYEFLVVLIKSDSMQVRWQESKELVEWICKDSYYECK